MTTPNQIGNEKLLAARAQIEALLKSYDIAGHVILACPGFVEVFMDLEPSFSKLKVHIVTEHGLAVRVRSNLADYNGDRDAQRRDLEATAGMVNSMAETLAHEAVTMIELTQTVDHITGAEHTPMTPVTRPPTPKQ